MPQLEITNYFRQPALRNKILVTIGFVLSFRLLAQVPAFNVEQERLNELLADNAILGLVDLFAGGDVLDEFSVVAAGILPYLTAKVLVGLSVWLLPPLRRLKEKPASEEKVKLYAKIASIPLAITFAWGISHYLAKQSGLFPDGFQLFTKDSFAPTLRVLSIVTLGSIISTWMSGQISKKGIGSGSSVLLLTGSGFAFADQIKEVIKVSESASQLFQHLGLIAVTGLIMILFALVLFRSQRRVPIIYPSAARQQSRFLKTSVENHIPLPFVSGGIQPVSTAIGLFSLAQLISFLLASYAGEALAGIANWIGASSSPQSRVYWITLATMVFALVYLNNFTMLWKPFRNSEYSMAETLKRSNGAFIKGVRPGNQTQVYLEKIVAKLTLIGATTLTTITVGIPFLIHHFLDFNILVTALSLIVFVKTLQDVQSKMQADLVLQPGYYEGLLTRRRYR